MEYVSAFMKYPRSSVKTLGEPFDYKSVMLYDEFAFSKDNISPTVIANNGQTIGPIWKKKNLSNIDVKRILHFYKCDGNKSKKGFPYNIKCSFNQNICGFKNVGQSVWNWKNDTVDGHVLNSFESVGSKTGYLVSPNMHPVRIDDSRGHLGCIRFWYIIQTDGDAYLKLSQAFIDKTTSLKYNPDITLEIWRNNKTKVNKWIQVNVPFYTRDPFKLIFESKFSRGNHYGTIAVDDVEIMYEDCKNVERRFLEKQLDTYFSFPNILDITDIPIEEPTEDFK